MTLQIPKSYMENLVHKSEEIRVRALEQIDAKIRRALALKQTIDFKAGDLCKFLIRWFGKQPIVEKKKVLALILELLNSPYVDDIEDKIGPNRLRKEFGKVQAILKNEPNLQSILEKILMKITEMQTTIHMDEMVRLTEAMSLNSDKSLAAGDGSGSLFSSRTQDGGGENCENCGILKACGSGDFEVAWTKIAPIDYNVLKSFNEVFVDFNSTKAKQEKTLQHMIVSMDDYPPEYYLQLPHTFCFLLDLFDRAGGKQVADVDLICNAITKFILSLETHLQVKFSTVGFLPGTVITEEEGKTQLKVEKAVFLLTETAIKKFSEISAKIDKNFLALMEMFHFIFPLYKKMKMTFEMKHLEGVRKAADLFKASWEHQDNLILDRLRYLAIYSLLEEMVDINCLKRVRMEEVDLLKPLLYDYAYMKNFSKNYNHLKTIFMNTNPVMGDQFHNAMYFEHCFTVAMNLLKKTSALRCDDIVNCGLKICVAAVRLESVKLIEILLNAIHESIPLAAANENLRENSSATIEALMSTKCVQLKVFLYNKVLNMIKMHLACIINGEQYSPGVTNAQLLEALILGLPLNNDLIKMIIYDGLDNPLEEIAKAAESLILCLINSQKLLKSYWNGFFNLLVPYLPLLISYSPKINMINSLLEVIQPDAKGIPFLEKLLSNIVFLFYNDNMIRSEALTRVVYIVQSMPDAENFVPNINEIQDIIPNDVLIQSVPKRLDHIFTTSEDFGDMTTLNSLLEILQAQDIEPSIRKSSLLQLNHLCRSYHLIGQFCDFSAFYLILQILENAMQKESYRDYKDAIIPALGILSKALLYDERFRKDLREIPNIYILLLRSLFMFHNDIQVRQDAVLALFLIIFCHDVEVDFENRLISLPKFVANIKVPVKFMPKIYHAKELFQDSELFLMFENKKNLIEYLRHHIAGCFYGDYFKIKRNYLEKQLSLDINSCFLLKQTDIAILKATSTKANLKIFMHGIQNATDHSSLVNACSLLRLQALVKRFIPDEYALEILNILNRYIQVPPGNNKDYDLYQNLLQLYMMYIRLGNVLFLDSLSRCLQQDFHHPLISLLKDISLPLRFYQSLCLMLKALVKSEQAFLETPPNGVPATQFFASLFDLVFNLAMDLFDKREIDYCRCLLNLLESLSAKFMNLTEKALCHYITGLIKISGEMKSPAQTGAAWQRNCLQSVCFLIVQIVSPNVICTLIRRIAKYVSTLCGHSDGQVRGLAWTILLSIGNCIEKTKDGITLLTQELSYLPGGFEACCLVTFFDEEEVLCCRETAGILFLHILNEIQDYDRVYELLQQHGIYRLIDDSIPHIRFNPSLPFDYKYTEPLVPCTIVTHYCRILFKMVQKKAGFSHELCEKSFMFKLYEILKMPDAAKYPESYRMCADICRLYAVLNADNFEFLQKTICRDRMFVNNFIDMIGLRTNAENDLNKLLQMLLILAKDSISYQYLCECFNEHPYPLLHICVKALDTCHMETHLQITTLGLISLLLIKSQETYDMYYPTKSENSSSINFIEIFDRVLNKSSTDNHQDDDENSKDDYQEAKYRSRKSSKKQNYFSEMAKTGDFYELFNIESIGGFCSRQLYGMLCHIYPVQVCDFREPPTLAQQQICDTYSCLLKFSSKATETAVRDQLIDKLIQILKYFFEDLKLPCSAFIRRYGDHKKVPIIKHLTIFMHFLLNWFSGARVVVLDESHAYEINKILINTWPWMQHSNDLKLYTSQVIAFVSERTPIVCRAFLHAPSSSASSILQMVVKTTHKETLTIKGNSPMTVYPVIALIRLLVNSCSCSDGRSALVKAKVYDIFDQIHPLNPKGAKIKTDLFICWLDFWEVFSRYTDGAIVRNLVPICTVINRSPPNSEIRLSLLRILRNMTFLNTNRTTLLGCTEYLATLDSILLIPLQEDPVVSYEEQVLVIISLWKLITGGAKYMALFRGSKIGKKFKQLFNNLKDAKAADPVALQQTPFAPDVLSILEIVFSYFDC